MKFLNRVQVPAPLDDSDAVRKQDLDELKNSKTPQYVETVSYDSEHTEFVLNHNLGTINLVVSAWEVSTNLMIATTVRAIDDNSVEVSFADNLENADYRVVIFGENSTIVTGNITAQQVKFSDGESFQEKYDSGTLVETVNLESVASNIKVAGTASAGTSSNAARADHVHPAQTSVTGNAGTATTLATSRTFRTDLSSTSTASFNGSANVTPGVTGTLPIGNGGTNATSASAALSNLGGMPLTGDTFTGRAYAQSNTSYTTQQIRNAAFSTSDLTAGSSSLANGNIYFVYE